MTRRTLIAACIAMLSLGGLRYPALAAAPAAGQVLASFGECFVEAGGQRSALRLGDPVHVGDTVDVAAGAKLKLRMNDGSVIAAASGTRLTIDNYAVGGDGQSRDAKLSLSGGLVRAVVATFKEPSHFEVDTATAVAAVRSTDWFIDARPGATQIGVLGGSVSLTSRATGKAVDIPARWGARVEAGRDPVPARVWTQAEFADFIARTNLD